VREKKKTKKALRKFQEKDDDESRNENWESGKAYKRTGENKRCICQEKTAEYINKLVRRKEFKK
jgi:hypothetical protein